MKKLSIGIVRVQHLRTTQAIRSPASHPSQGIAHCRYGFHKTVPNCLAASLPAFAGAYDDQGINEYVRGGRPTFSCLIFRAQCRAKARASTSADFIQLFMCSVHPGSTTANAANPCDMYARSAATNKTASIAALKRIMKRHEPPPVRTEGFQGLTRRRRAQ